MLEGPDTRASAFRVGQDWILDDAEVRNQQLAVNDDVRSQRGLLGLFLLLRLRSGLDLLAGPGLLTGLAVLLLL